MFTKSIRTIAVSFSTLSILATTLSTFAQVNDEIKLPNDEKIISLGSRANKKLTENDGEYKKEVDSISSDLSKLSSEQVLQLRKQIRYIRADVDEIQNEKNIDKLERAMLKNIQKSFGKDKHFYNLTEVESLKLESIFQQDVKIKELQNAIINKDISDIQLSKLFGNITTEAACPSSPSNYNTTWYGQGYGNYSYIYPWGWDTVQTPGTNDCDYRLYKAYHHLYVNGANYSGACILTTTGNLRGYISNGNDRVIVGNVRATICGAFGGGVVANSLRFR